MSRKSVMCDTKDWPRTVLLPPYHSDWWLITLDLIPIVDKIQIFDVDYHRREEQKAQDTYHSVVWDRLQYACEKKIVEVVPFEGDLVKIDKEAHTKLDLVLADKEQSESLANDLIFAYEEWLAYNRTKLTLLDPVLDENYISRICDNYTVSMKDLNALKTLGAKAWAKTEKIAKVTGFNLFRKVLLLKAAAAHADGLPLETEKEYEPFLKYVTGQEKDKLRLDLEFKDSPQTRKLLATLEKAKHVPFPVPWSMQRPRLRISHRTFVNLFVDLRKIYEEYRRAIANYIDTATGVAVELASSVPPAAADGLIKARDRYMASVEAIETRAKRIGRYATLLSFGGAALPPPLSFVVAIPLVLAGLSSKDLSIALETLSAYTRGYSPRGLANYYGFLDSIARSQAAEKVAYEFWRSGAASD